MEPATIVLLVLGGIVAIFLLGVFFGSFFTIEQAHAGVVQRLGKFLRIAQPGLNFKAPYLDVVVANISLQVQQLDVKVETKTKDNVFVQIPISVQYKVMPDRVYDAFYKLSDPIKQIESFVYNVILGHVPKMTLDETFDQQSQIAIDVKNNLDASMSEFGYSIVKSLITDLVPDEKVKAAMNDINAAQREREATVSRAETEKLLLVKKAEADAESKRLQGEGIANQRKAIVEGLRDSVAKFSESVEGATPKDAMAMVLLTQYFDTLKEVAGTNRSNTIMMPHTPNALTDLFSQFRNAIITGEIAARAPDAPAAPAPAPRMT
ncbi:MAG TPA: SPFH domain-containing protein [Candidatus Acidoferrum sp.]|jgi:regulator of protease activity HflC (stomatin/prohibitin superfamily)|nr:SPFH domain-containing protein [Candidatus Acidoferrum sp.]